MDRLDEEDKTYAIPYKTRDNAYIVVKTIDEPYGDCSESVVSVGCTLKGDIDNPSWKVHIPMSLVKDVRWALKFALDDFELAQELAEFQNKPDQEE